MAMLLYKTGIPGVGTSGRAEEILGVGRRLGPGSGQIEFRRKEKKRRSGQEDGLSTHAEAGNLAKVTADSHPPD